MPTIIDMKGVWSAARNTQAEIQEVNRPGYQGAPRVAEGKPLARRAPSKQTALKAE
jgi:hypothetical protein